MNLLYRSKEPVDGYWAIVSPSNSPLQKLEFGLVRLSHEGLPYANHSGTQEIALVLLHGSGRVEVESGANEPITYELAGRRDVFIEMATMVYRPPETGYRIISHSEAFEAGVFKAPASQTTASFVIPPDEIKSRLVGAGNWRRNVIEITRNDMPIERLIVGETISPPGNWSSYPPHKHDEWTPDGEAPYEEVFHYRVKPKGGYGIQQLYDAPGRESALDEVYVVRNGDTLAIPHGYHPIVAAGGYQVYYLWALSGDARVYAAWSDDPAHSWIRGCEPILNGQGK